MMRLELRPFDAGFLDDAARLLAARHAAGRAVEPALPAAYEREDVTRAAIEDLLTNDASGAVATRNGTTVGYLIGTPRADPLWGPNVWVEAAGHAVSEPEAARDLYAHAASRWVEEGRTSHYALVPASDGALVDAWFRVGFGQQHVHAIREAPASPFTESRQASSSASRRATTSTCWRPSSSPCRPTSSSRRASPPRRRRRSRRLEPSGTRTSTIPPSRRSSAN